MKIYLFHYLRQEHLIDFLQTGLLKVTNLSNTNDPFESRPGLSLDGCSQVDELRHRVAFWRESQHAFQVEPNLAVCLSATCSSPVMWGHYTNCHRGACLAFKFDVEEDKKLPPTAEMVAKVEKNGSLGAIRYDENRVLCLEQNSDIEGVIHFIMDLKTTKSKEWAYEKEIRYIFCNKDFIFKENLLFTRALSRYLDGVILGCRCPLSHHEVTALLEKSSPFSERADEITTAFARMSDTEFKINCETLGGCSHSYVDMDQNVYKDFVKGHFWNIM